jgi:hypothetical protein
MAEDVINIFQDEDKVQVIFSKGTGKVIYRDALWFYTIEDYNNTTSEMIEEMKTERYNNWLIAINGE